MLEVSKIENLDSPRSVRGYFKEVFVYFSFLFRIRHHPSIKFVVLTTGRTGSNLLVELLNSHPLIHCESELLLRRVAFPKLFLRCNENLSRKEVYGFKLNTYNFFVQGISNTLQFVEELHDRKYSLICLKRRNLLRQAISRMYAYQTKKFHLRKENDGSFPSAMEVDMDQLQNEINLFEYQNRIVDQILENLPYLQLFYEDDLSDGRNHQTTIDRISEYLGIPTGRVSSTLVKTTPEDLSSLIKNYDEFRKFILETKYAEYLEFKA